MCSLLWGRLLDKICFTMCGWIDERSRKMEMRINVCCRYENMWWNMKFIYTLKSVLVLAKDISTFEPTQNLVLKNTRLRLEFELVWICAYGRRLLLLWGSDYIFCVLFVVITIVKFGVKVFIRGNPFYWVLITKKSVRK